VLSFVSALTLSGTALAALVCLEGAPIRAETPQSFAKTKSAALLVDSEAERFVAAPVREVPAVEAATSDPTESPEAVVVPDFTGRSLTSVMREARRLKIRLVAQDAYGERITADFAEGYRVRRQLTEPGTRISPRDVVQVRVRFPAALLQGY
jgi:hypothetical protein